MWHVFVGLLLGVGWCGVLGFDFSIANSSVWLSGAAYCGKDAYLTMQPSGAAIGFRSTHILYDPVYDLQGYVGILENTRTIYVVFRGSSSKLNWLDDIEIKKVVFTGCANCEVHDGFYKTTQNLKEQVRRSISEIQMGPTQYVVVVTGHSLGAAVAQMMAHELKEWNPTVYNFGQPRIGNKEYATYTTNVINLYRTTHNKDLVPHTPPESFGFYHSSIEIFESDTGLLKECSSTNGEDPTCSNQFKMSEFSTKDHHVYLTHDMDCDKSILPY
jgi:hypothetical protein